MKHEEWLGCDFYGSYGAHRGVRSVAGTLRGVQNTIGSSVFAEYYFSWPSAARFTKHQGPPIAIVLRSFKQTA
jgi:hypothetical protein